MENLTKISKPIDTILNILSKLLISACIVLTVVLGAFIFIPSFEDTGIEGNWSLTLGNVKLDLAEGVAETAQMQVMLISLTITMIVMTIFTCYFIKILRNILAPMIQGQPFVGTVSGDLKKLGILLIVNSVVFGLVNAIGNAAIFSAFDISNLLLSDKIVGVNMNLSIIDTKTIFIGILVILLSHVFSYGEKLQQQDDETL